MNNDLFLTNEKLKIVEDDIKIGNYPKLNILIKNMNFDNIEKDFLMRHFIKTKILEQQEDIRATMFSIVDFNFQNPSEENSTCLMLMIKEKDLNTLEKVFLLDSLNFNPNTQDSNGNTFFHYLICLTESDSTILKLLQKSFEYCRNNSIYFDLNIINSSGEIPLSLSLQLGLSKISEELILNGSNPKFISYDGSNLLHYAVKSKNPSCVIILKDYVDPTSVNKGNISALDLAKMMNLENIYKLL